MQSTTLLWTRRQRDALEKGDVLGNHESLRVPMWAMDSTSGKSTVAIATDAGSVVTDAVGDASVAALSRSGSRHLAAGHRSVDHAVQMTRELNRQQAWADSVHGASNAWKGGSNDRLIPLTRDTGDPVADAYMSSVDVAIATCASCSSRRRGLC